MLSGSAPSVLCPFCKSLQVQKRGFSKGEEKLQRFQCRSCAKWFAIDQLDLIGAPEFFLPSAKIKEIENEDRYIVTCAQNNTPLHKGMWETILTFAKAMSARIIVLPIRYRNPTAFLDPQDDGETVWWPEEVLDYLVENHLQIHPKLMVMGHVRINATAAHPLATLESMSKDASAIYGHPQIQMRSIPTPQNSLPKILYTTGSTSQKNYSKTKAGVRGRFHHSLGATVVEKSGKLFHIRSVSFDGRGFYDLDKYYSSEGVEASEGIEALVTGDEHVLFHSPAVKAATYTNSDSIVNVLKPKVIVRHDVFDGYSISHHHRGNPFTNYVKYKTGMNKVEDELKATLQFIEETTPDWATTAIVASNHNEHLYRWLCECDPKAEPWNARIYHWFMYNLYDKAEMTPYGASTVDPFELWCKENSPCPRIRFLKREDPFTIGDIELSLHGDRGSDGARGTLLNFSKIGVKTVIGHRHSPGIEKGVFQVGTSSHLKLEYTSGPSSWLNTHCLLFKNNKRQLIHIIDGEWRGR